MKVGDAKLILNRGSDLLKFFIMTIAGSQERHSWECHDVGTADVNPPDGDPYGHDCKMPPGEGYTIGAPQDCGPDSDDGVAYGYYFTPIGDNPAGDLAAHGRDGLGIHGGGSDLAEPFAPRQGWEWTFGCPRMQNADNQQLVDSIRYVQAHGGTVTLDVVGA